MHRCLQLASLGLGSVAPNPLVGAVLVYDQSVIGEGWHRQYGKEHAEVNCILSVRPEQLPLIPLSTLYVNLEPCHHYGKTPPCTRLIIEKQIKKVVVGSLDPHPIVSGKGIQSLRAAGIEVVENVAAEDCIELNRRFFTFHQKKRPYVILKMAQSADGFMAPEGGNKRWLTNEFSRTLTHRWRTEEQAILIGKNTAIIDNPQLTARHWKGRHPVRILIDPDNEVPLNRNIFDEQAPTIVFNLSRDAKKNNVEWKKITFGENAEIQILNHIAEKEIQSVIVEGGPFTAEAFLRAGVVDEIRLLTAPVFLRKGLKTPEFSASLNYELRLGDNEIKIYKNL